MSDINGITADPLAKVAQALTRHDERLEDHERRLGDIEDGKAKDERERRSFTWVLLLQTALFIANMVASYLSRR